VRTNCRSPQASARLSQPAPPLGGQHQQSVRHQHQMDWLASAETTSEKGITQVRK
jgi:hypothetical protein